MKCLKPAWSCFVLLLAALLSGVALAQNPVPLINDPLVPASAAPGGADFTLTVNGTGFVPGSTANWNGTPLATTFINSSQLTATVPGAEIATSGTASVVVVNPAPGGGSSNVDFFEVRQPFSAASFDLAKLSPGSQPVWVISAD